MTMRKWKSGCLINYVYDGDIIAEIILFSFTSIVSINVVFDLLYGIILFISKCVIG